MSLFLRDHQLAVFNPQTGYAFRQFELITLFRQLFLQCRINQGDGNAEVTNLELSRIEGHVPILRPEMACERHVDVYSPDLGQELAARNISLKLHLIIFDLNFSGANHGIG